MTSHSETIVIAVSALIHTLLAYRCYVGNSDGRRYLHNLNLRGEVIAFTTILCVPIILFSHNPGLIGAAVVVSAGLTIGAVSSLTAAAMEAVRIIVGMYMLLRTLHP